MNYDSSREANELRARALPQVIEDRTRFPDFIRHEINAGVFSAKIELSTN
jgi:hypothetical protein